MAYCKFVSFNVNAEEWYSLKLRGLITLCCAFFMFFYELNQLLV